MLIGLDTEYSFSRAIELKGRLHADITTMQPVCACLYFEDGRVLRVIDRWTELQNLFDDADHTFVVHGCQAESLFCDRVGLRFPGRFYDTQLMGLLVLHMLTFHLPGGVYNHARLGDLTSRFGIPFPWGVAKDLIRESIMRGTHMADFGMEQVLNYCCADARACLQLFAPLRSEMIRRCGSHTEKHLIELYQPYALHMANAARKGIRFDSASWDRLLETAPRYRRRLLSIMEKWGYRHDGEGLGRHGFRLMIKALGLQSRWPTTPTGQLSTKTDDLKGRRHQHTAIDATYKLAKFDAFVAQDMGTRVDNDGRIRCSILTLAQRTSRNSTSSPNLMGIPGEQRPLLLPDEGCKFIHFDYSQQEPGVAAWLSGDRALLKDFADGDVYVNSGLRMGIIQPGMPADDIADIRSTLLKALMLAIIYGKGVASIARDIPCSIGEAAVHLRIFEQTYPQLFRWLRGYVAASMERGWAESIIGFRAAFDAANSCDRGHIARSCQNFPIQSSAAACFQLTGVYLGDFGADIRLPLQDAYLINVPDDLHEIAKARTWIEAAATAATNQLFPGLAVKLHIEVLSRFAKNGHEESFEKWVAALKGELCFVK